MLLHLGEMTIGMSAGKQQPLITIDFPQHRVREHTAAQRENCVSNELDRFASHLPKCLERYLPARKAARWLQKLRRLKTTCRIAQSYGLLQGCITPRSLLG